MPVSLGLHPGEVTCPNCHSKMNIKWEMVVEAAPEDNLNVVAPGISAAGVEKLKVLVAVDGEATQDVMKEVLTGAGYEVFIASTGKEALSILEKEHPKLAYLDVALPQVLGFEVCEIIKKSQRLKSTKVILVSAIYDKTRYKRAPSSLYGADDYIERHHIQDGLLAKLSKLLYPAATAPLSPETPPLGSTVEVMDKETLSPRHGVREAESTQPPALPIEVPPIQQEVQIAAPVVSEPTPEIEVKPEAELPPELPKDDLESQLGDQEIGSDLEITEVPLVPPVAVPELTPEEKVKHEEAKRFARLIISDIALYNQKTIEEGIENGNVEELLKDDLAEAEKLFRERVSKEIREKTHYLQEALQDLVDRKIKMIKKGN
jgi:CheY-like chemotaxis protein